IINIFLIKYPDIYRFDLIRIAWILSHQQRVQISRKKIWIAYRTPTTNTLFANLTPASCSNKMRNPVFPLLKEAELGYLRIIDLRLVPELFVGCQRLVEIHLHRPT